MARQLSWLSRSRATVDYSNPAWTLDQIAGQAFGVRSADQIARLAFGVRPADQIARLAFGVRPANAPYLSSSADHPSLCAAFDGDQCDEFLTGGCSSG